MIKVKQLRVQEKQLTSFKVIIRKLPPLLTANAFYKRISQFKTAHRLYLPGKLKAKDKVYSRCYLYFENESDMQNFLATYPTLNIIFCDNQGIYYKPEVKQSLYQNWNDIKNAPPENKAEGSYEKSEHFLEFVKSLEAKKLEQTDLGEFERKPGQALNEEKTKKFEKVKTQLVIEIEKEREEERKRKEQIDKMESNVIISAKRVFIYVPKAKD